MEWSTSCPDWADRLRAGQSIIPPPLFPEVAEQALSIFRELRIVDAPGSPTFGESCAQWVFDLVGSIFGAYDPSSGRRLITEWFVCLPKKNSKSTIAAGIMMTALILNWRLSAEFTILAPTIEIANNSFGPSRDMVKRDEELEEALHVQQHIKTITHREHDATLKVVAADSNTVGGKKSVGTLIDELWLFGMQADAENMLREAVGGLASRPEGFVIYLTTQSDEPPAGVFLQKLLYARQVRDGKIIDPRFVPVIYEFPEDMVTRGEHRDPVNWGMVNPNLGFSVDREFLEREFKKAESTGEGSVRGFMAKHLNVEIGLSLRSDRWPGADYWEAAGERMTLEQFLDRSEVVDVGVDGGGLDDLLALTLVGRDAEGCWLTWSRCWAHAKVLERRKEIAPRLQDFAAQGDLVIVRRLGDDIVQLVDVIEQVFAADLLDLIGVDPAGIGSIVEEIEARGISSKDGAPGLNKIVGVSQGWKLSGAVKTAERKVASGELKHAAQPLMAWQVSNAKIEPNRNSQIVTKQASGTGKIDALMALFNAVTLMSLNPAARRLSADFAVLVV
jgi:phage terminase large subunit-like protein